MVWLITGDSDCRVFYPCVDNYELDFVLNSGQRLSTQHPADGSQVIANASDGSRCHC